MKIINHFYADYTVSSKDLYEFLKLNYEYVDALTIGLGTFIEELHSRGKRDTVSFLNRIFSNSYYRNPNEQVVTSSPAFVFEVYEYLIAECENKNKLPCLSEHGSFLDICYHYDIPVFIENLEYGVNNVIGFEANWKFTDLNLYKKMKEEYFLSRFYIYKAAHEDERYLIYLLKKVDGITTFALNNSQSSISKELHRLKEYKYKELTKQGADLVFSKDSLSYLYQELIG